MQPRRLRNLMRVKHTALRSRVIPRTHTSRGLLSVVARQSADAQPRRQATNNGPVRTPREFKVRCLPTSNARGSSSHPRSPFEFAVQWLSSRHVMSCERKLDPHIQAAPKCLTKYDTDDFVHVLQEAHSLDNVHVRRRMIATPILRYGRGVALDGRRRWSGCRDLG